MPGPTGPKPGGSSAWAQRCSDDADNALRIDPQYAYANEIKGRCLIDLDRAEEALSYFDTAIALAPGYQNAYRNKLAALAALGRHEEVVAVADEALRPGRVPDSNPLIEEDILSRRLLALARICATRPWSPPRPRPCCTAIRRTWPR